jgi:carbon-monoxide dehydrogenase iron sulfur subunit
MKVLKMIPEKCTGCMRCELACSYEQTGTFRPSKSVIRVSAFENHTSYAPYTCPQCDEAWCMTACPIEAISISSPGAKEVNNNLCVGCKLCTIACPYGTIFFDPETHKAFKCDLCGGNPACQTVCPTGAIEYIEVDENSDWIGSFASDRSRGPSGPLSLEVG